jgi:hypothetical protein
MLCEAAGLPERPGILWKLSTGTMEELAEVAQRRLYRRGELVDGARREEGGIFAVGRGEVHLYTLGENQTKHSLGYCHTGEAFELSRTDEVLPSESLGEVLVDGTAIYSMPWASFVGILRDSVSSLECP